MSGHYWVDPVPPDTSPPFSVLDWLVHGARGDPRLRDPCHCRCREARQLRCLPRAPGQGRRGRTTPRLAWPPGRRERRGPARHRARPARRRPAPACRAPAQGQQRPARRRARRRRRRDRRHRARAARDPHRDPGASRAASSRRRSRIWGSRRRSPSSRRACRSPSIWTCPPRACPPVPRSPPTSSSPKRSPTPPSTPTPTASRCASPRPRPAGHRRDQDDGRGGANAYAGTGLLGLADRVDTLDGSLSIASAAGHGTTVTAEFSCAS